MLNFKLFLYPIFLLFVVPIFAMGENDSLLVILENDMKNRAEFDAKKEERITALKSKLRKETKDLDKYNTTNQIIKEYLAYQLDSVLLYMNQNIALAKKFPETHLADRVKIQLAGVLSSTGNYTESLDILKSIHKSNLPENDLNEFYHQFMWTYFRASFYSPLSETKNKYLENYTAYKDSLLNRLDPNETLYLTIIERDLRDVKNFKESNAVNEKLLSRYAIGTREYSMIAFSLALNYRLTKKYELEKKYLILSSISDIRASVKDNAASTELAMMLFKEGQIERAHNFINFAFEDAAFFNSKLRFISISNILPIVNKAYEKDIDEKNKKLQTSLIIISLLGLFSLAALFYIFRQNRHLSVARKGLENANAQLIGLNEKLLESNEKLSKSYDEISELNQVKENYIANLLVLCAEYIDNLEIYRRTVNKMIVTHKINDLLEKTKSKDIIDNEMRNFNHNFDTIFLNIYPNFVEKMNDLLVDEEKIILKNGELLNTEIRIFALIRLGINDSATISKILRYSVNTIYNYRVKIKNKAKGSREDFEQQIMAIGSISK